MLNEHEFDECVQYVNNIVHGYDGSIDLELLYQYVQVDHRERYNAQ